MMPINVALSLNMNESHILIDKKEKTFNKPTPGNIKELPILSVKDSK